MLMVANKALMSQLHAKIHEKDKHIEKLTSQIEFLFKELNSLGEQNKAEESMSRSLELRLEEKEDDMDAIIGASHNEILTLTLTLIAFIGASHNEMSKIQANLELRTGVTQALAAETLSKKTALLSLEREMEEMAAKLEKKEDDVYRLESCIESQIEDREALIEANKMEVEGLKEVKEGLLDRDKP